MGGIEGIGDRYSDSYGNYEQYNTYFYYGGVKVYPFHTGLALTGKIGAGRLVADISGYGSEATGMGLALGGTIAYDFNRKSRGFGFETGLSLNYLGNMDFYGESISASQLFIFGKLLWK